MYIPIIKVIPQYCIAYIKLSLLPMIIASLAYTHGCVYVHKIRGFPEAKHNSKENACFLLTEHGDLNLLLLNFGTPIICFELKN